ncbi:Uncharacterised protein [Serratia marcescens]|nr:Uncharacterised protein [Serratia marcescens]
MVSIISFMTSRNRILKFRKWMNLKRRKAWLRILKIRKRINHRILKIRILKFRALVKTDL